MDIKKLTITPIISGTKGFTLKEPSAERAQLLIKEKLSSRAYFNIGQTSKRSKSKLPAFLKGFINLKTRVQ